LEAGLSDFVTVAGAVLDFHELPDSRDWRAPENVDPIMKKIFLDVQHNAGTMSQIDYICVDPGSDA